MFTYTRTKKTTTRRWDFGCLPNSEMYTSFLDSARCAAWSAVKELGERLKWRLHNTQKDLKEEKEDTIALKKTISQLQSDMEKLVSKLSVQGDLIKNKDEQIANLQKQLDQNNGSAQKRNKKF
jgi:peptidoglycan hydrolase CwlO-like protein